MKKILLAAFTLVSTLGFNAASAQTFVTTTGMDTVAGNIGSLGDIDIHNDIKSLVDSVKITWKVESYNFAPGITTSGFCDNANCWLGAPLLAGSSYTSDYYYKNVAGTFKAQYLDDGTAAVGSVSSMTILTAGGATTKKLVFVVTKTTTGLVTTVKEEAVNVYPNPARDFVNVKYDPRSGVKSIAVYNLIGKTVQNYKVTDNSSARLDLDNIPAGVYFMRLMNAQGQIVATRRFTRQ